MGTNYFHRTNICDKCGHYNETHIGKSSAGWTFSFHATEAIRSWKQWQSALQAAGKIFDEYGSEISFAEFFSKVEGKKTEHNNHTTYCLASERDAPYAGFLDDEGNSFSDGEFS